MSDRYDRSCSGNEKEEILVTTVFSAFFFFFWPFASCVDSVAVRDFWSVKRYAKVRTKLENRLILGEKRKKKIGTVSHYWILTVNIITLCFEE